MAGKEIQEEEVKGIGEGGSLLDNISENLPGLVSDEEAGRDYSWEAVENKEKQEKTDQESQEEGNEETQGETREAQEESDQESQEEQEGSQEAQDETREEGTGEEASGTQQQFMDRIKEVAPDTAVQNQEQAFKAAMDVMDEYKTMKAENDKTKEQYKEFMDAVQDDPSKAQFIKDLQDGANLEEAAYLNLDMDSLNDMEDEPDSEDLSKRKKERQENLKQMKEQEKVIEGNQETSYNNISEFAKEQELSQDQTAKFIDQVKKYMDEYDQGLISKDFLNTLYTALSKDEEVKKAKKAGEIKGKNQKINENLNKQRASKKGDGMPHPKGNTKVQENRQKEPDTGWMASLREHENRRKRL